MTHSNKTRFHRRIGLPIYALVLLAFVADFAAGQTDTARRQAGNWQQTQTLVALDISQASPAITAAARTSVGRSVVSERVCVSPAEVMRDSLTSRLAVVALSGADFRWTRLEVRDTVLKASGSNARGTITIEGKLTPVLTDVTATSNIIDPVMGPARRVQRTVVARLGPC